MDCQSHGTCPSHNAAVAGMQLQATDRARLWRSDAEAPPAPWRLLVLIRLPLSPASAIWLAPIKKEFARQESVNQDRLLAVVMLQWQRVLCGPADAHSPEQ